MVSKSRGSFQIREPFLFTSTSQKHQKYRPQLPISLKTDEYDPIRSLLNLDGFFSFPPSFTLPWRNISTRIMAKTCRRLQQRNASYLWQTSTIAATSTFLIRESTLSPTADALWKTTFILVFLPIFLPSHAYVLRINCYDLEIFSFYKKSRPARALHLVSLFWC
jgi:hypothetical protein